MLAASVRRFAGNFGSEGGIRLFAAIAQRILRSSSPLATLELVVTWAMRSLRSDDILRPGGFEVRHNAERVLPSPIAFVKDTLLLHIPGAKTLEGRGYSNLNPPIGHEDD